MKYWPKSGESERDGIGLYVEATLIGLLVFGGYIAALTYLTRWLASQF